MSSREDFHSIDIASAIDDGALRQSLADILHRHAKALTMKRTSSYQEELQTFQQQALEATAAVVVSRDLRLLEAIVNSSGVSAALSHVENARLSPMPAEEWHGLNAEEALTKFADALDQTRQARQFEIMQRLLLEIMAGDRPSKNPLARTAKRDCSPYHRHSRFYELVMSRGWPPERH